MGREFMSGSKNYIKMITKNDNTYFELYVII